MAKQVNTNKIGDGGVVLANPVKRDKTPEQALHEDWPTKHKELGPYITELGRMRGGLTPSQQTEARKILKSYGF